MTDSSSQNPFSLAGTHTLITGGSRGLGNAAARAVARAGGAVTIVARSVDQARVAAADLAAFGATAHAYPADVARLDQLQEIVDAVSEISPIHGVVHAAGIQLRKPAVEVTADEFTQVQNVNVNAPYLLSTAVARTQIARGIAGSHVFIGSLNSSIALPNISPYAVSKTGLVGVARALSVEWAAYSIRSNIIGPGYFETEMTKKLLANPTDYDRILARIPMRRLGDPSDVGNACVYLLSQASRYVTGTLHNVDGGWLGA